ncbi:MAG: phosphomannomutase/phosphoglucomutase [Bacillota bacterium]
MEEINLSRLESGTDIRGTAIGDKDEVDLTEEAVIRIGKGFARWLAEHKKKDMAKLRISIGVDSRLSAERLKNNLITGLNSQGVSVFDAGLASTPAMFMSTVLAEHGYDGAIMITASHLPFDRNGFKFFTDQGGMEKENVHEILRLAEKAAKGGEVDELSGKVEQINLLDDYADHIKNVIRDGVYPEVDNDQPLAGFHIVLDAGNGAGGFFADKILEPLGCDTRGSQFLEPDGHFPNHPPNPENKEAMASIKEAAVKNEADLGIIFDTDVDRAAVVDASGRAINRNRLIALAAVVVLEEEPGATIVTDSVTSVGLSRFIEEKLGGSHHRFKRGYKNVINEARRLVDAGINAPLAIETSGHAAFRENYFLDDGAYLIAKILIKMANMAVTDQGGIGDLIADLQEVEIKREYRMKIELDEYKEYGDRVITELKKQVEAWPGWEIAPNNYQGVRVNCGGVDWFLLRMSLHDPVLVLNIECNTEEVLQEIIAKLTGFLEQFDHVQTEPLP